MLRATLWLYDSEKGFTAYESSQLDSLELRWNSRPSTFEVGCIDITFGPAEAPEFLSNYRVHEPSIFVTAGAAMIIGEHAMLCESDVYLRRYGLTHRVLSWDNGTPRAPERTQPAEVVQKQIIQPTIVANWVELYNKEHPEFRPDLDEAGIVDEETYRRHDHMLSHDMRLHVGSYRFNTFYSETAGYDTVRLIVPMWLRGQRINTAILAKRITNVFDIYNIETWSDALDRSQEDFMKLRNCGKKSVDDLTNSLVMICSGQVMHQPPMPAAAGGHGLSQAALSTVPSYASFQDAFDAAVNAGVASRLIKSRDVGMLWDAIGYRCAPRTYEDIAASLQITRERVRQIVESCASALRESGYLRVAAHDRLARVIHDSDDPTFIHEIRGKDTWFDETCTLSVITFLLKKVWTDTLQIKGKGADAILLPQIDGSIDDYLTQVESKLQELAEQQMYVDSLEEHLQCIDTKIPMQVVRYALQRLESKMQTAADPNDGRMYLVTYGDNLDHIIRQVLESAPRPLTVEEIHDQITAMGHDYALSSVAGRAHLSGIRFDHRIYGVRRHLNMTDSQLAEMITNIETVIASDIDRQWHLNDVKRFLASSGLYDIDALPISDHAIVYLCDASANIESPGYFALRHRGSKASMNGAERIKIMETVVKILDEHGSPMPIRDVREELRRRRGITEHQQIVNAGPVIHLRNGLVGLVERDIPLTSEDYEKLFTTLRDARDRFGIEPDSEEGVALASDLLGSHLGMLDELGIRGIIQRNLIMME